MSSIIKTQTAAGADRYKLMYRAPNGANRSKTFKLMREAQAFETKVRYDVATGTFVDPSFGRITFKVYAETWLARRRPSVRQGTIETYESHVRKHLGPTFGHRELRSITREEVKAWAATMTTVQATTARSVLFTLAAILREALDDGRIVKNPADRIKVGTATERRVDPMHVANIAGKVPALAAAMPDRWSAAVLLMASTGLRLGECLGLTVDRVDFLRRTIRVDRQHVWKNGAVSYGPPKTRASIRTIPVSRFVVELLAAHLAEFPPAENGLIFATGPTRENEGGLPISRNRWSDAYRVACVAAGVEGRTRTHDLRHVAASSMIAGGLSPAAVQAVLGHASPSETLDVYTHLWPTDDERTRIVMEQAASQWMPKTG